MVMNNPINLAPRAAGDQNGTLVEAFQECLPWNLARIKCFVLMVLAIIEEMTVSLQWMSKAGAPDVKSDSRRRRFERFIGGFCFKQRSVGALILSLLPTPDEGWVLAMDRTNWKFGRKHGNILTVTVVLEGAGFPIAWLTLPAATKRGNSAKRHRIKIMERVLDIIPAEKIRALTMDREFVGKRWLGWLDLVDVPYVVRLRKNASVGGCPAMELCRYGRWRKHAAVRREVFGRQVFFAAKRIENDSDPHVAVISNRYGGEVALKLYHLRWGIETFFGHLKKRGFKFETTHITKPGRIDKLVAVPAVAFTLCHRWGARTERRQGRKIKKHGYRARSVFRIGFESMHEFVKRPQHFAARIKEFVLHVIMPPKREIFVG